LQKKNKIQNTKIQKSKNPKIQKNQFFRKVFAKVKNGHFFSEKNVQNQDPQKSFGKKSFFFIVTNRKTFFRK
jgi:hypothetical protein